MDLLRPLERGQSKAAEIALSGEGDGVMNADRVGVQADAKFFRAILMALALTTLFLGMAAVMAMS